MNYPWMIVAGATLVGWLSVEAFAVFGKARVPIGMNFIGAAAGALIAGGMVL